MESIWTKTCRIPKREPLQRDKNTEVAVIGAGMAGILIAYQLQKAGKQVILLEANRIASGQTRNTTAKITSQHGLKYAALLSSHGEDQAQQYAMANEEAITAYRQIITEEKIPCDFQETAAFVYGQDKRKLMAEAEAAASLGISASFQSHAETPFGIFPALRFDGQAQFHPLKFIRHLAEQLEIYEKTPVETIDDHTLHTPKGKVTAEHIVFATHYPFVNFPGLYFARMHQERSYVLALENAPLTEGMFIGDGENNYSFRIYDKYLLFGGEGHRTGVNREGGKYAALRQKAKELFPDAQETAHWSAQDCMPVDGIPYIGRYAAGKPDWYVATGFQKWGMTTSMVAALLLRDLICGKENPYVKVFDPQRFSMEAAEGIACEMKEATKTLARRFFKLPETTEQELPVGHGGIVEVDGDKIGVYKDEDGATYMVNIRCPHLGCQLDWNPDEKSWDCPCHGSRFDFRGHLINNPAQEDIFLNKERPLP